MSRRWGRKGVFEFLTGESRLMKMKGLLMGEDFSLPFQFSSIFSLWWENSPADSPNLSSFCQGATQAEARAA